MPDTVIGHASAQPTKEFFVRMLTRDISIDDCILDLIDNSVDAAWSNEGGPLPGIDPSDRLAGYSVQIHITDASFEITDNCGGLSQSDAETHAFNFGNMFMGRDETLSVGVYGIGMKRAVFKLGSEIKIISTWRDGGTLKTFEVPIDVAAWLQTGEGAWDFQLVAQPTRPEAGVSVHVDNLSPQVEQTFRDPGFLPRLRRTISRDYMLALGHGMTITVNDEPVARPMLSLRSGGEFTPMREDYTDGEVQVTILAGMSRAPGDESGPEDVENDRPDSGWNIFCNGRAVLTADTTSLSGWGVPPTPRWHPQYNGFGGYVFFVSHQPSALPMTTTKRSVDTSSPVYKRALGRMSTPARAWIDYTNARKTRTEEAKTFEASATSTPLAAVTPSTSLHMPRLASASRPVANINFSRPRDEVQALGKAFGNRLMSYRDVGIAAFKFAFAEKVDEDPE